MSRSTLNSNRRYSERVSAPQSEADWQLAFRDPNSPISKLIDNIVADKNVAAEDRLYVLMDRMQVQRHEELKEREAFFLSNLQSEMKKRELANEQRINYLKEAAVPYPRESTNREQTINNYMNHINSLNTHIAQLSQEVKKLDAKIAIIEKKEKVLSDKWIAREDAGFDAVVKELTAKGIAGLKTGSGAIIPLAEIKKPFAPTPPAHVLKANLPMATSPIADEAAVLHMGLFAEIEMHGMAREAAGHDALSSNLKPSEMRKRRNTNSEIFNMLDKHNNNNFEGRVQEFKEARKLILERVALVDQKDVLQVKIKQAEEAKDQTDSKLLAMGVKWQESGAQTKMPNDQQESQPKVLNWPPTPKPKGFR